MSLNISLVRRTLFRRTNSARNGMAVRRPAPRAGPRPRSSWSMGPRRREDQSASPHRADCPEPGLVPAV